MSKNKNKVKIKSILDLRAEQSNKSVEEMIGIEIRDYLDSVDYKIVKEANNYALNRSDVQKKTNSVASRSNTKIEHPILRKLIKQ